MKALNSLRVSKSIQPYVLVAFNFPLFPLLSLVPLLPTLLRINYNLVGCRPKFVGRLVGLNVQQSCPP